MTVYTYSEARQRLSSVLDEAERDGSVRIRRDGYEFELVPVERAVSPFDVDGAALDLSADYIHPVGYPGGSGAAVVTPPHAPARARPGDHSVKWCSRRSAFASSVAP